MVLTCEGCGSALVVSEDEIRTVSIPFDVRCVACAHVFAVTSRHEAGALLVTDDLADLDPTVADLGGETGPTALPEPRDQLIDASIVHPGPPQGAPLSSRRKRESVPISVDPERADAVDRAENTARMLQTWGLKAQNLQHAHIIAARRHQRLHYSLGIPVVVLSSVVGTTVFATLEQQSLGVASRVLVGAISVIAAVLASMQTFLRLGERAELHHSTASRYSTVRRQIDEALNVPTNTLEQLISRVGAIGREMDSINAEEPTLSKSDKWEADGEYTVGMGGLNFDARRSTKWRSPNASPSVRPLSAGRK